MKSVLPKYLVAELHPSLNQNIDIDKLTSGSTKVCTWVGLECKHVWDASVRARVRGDKCPYCSNRAVLIGFNDLATTQPVIASEWHPTLNGDLKPTDITAGSRKVVYWLGKDCSHVWDCAVKLRRQYGCPVCSGKRVVADINDLPTLNHSLAAEWHPTLNGDFTPVGVSPNSHKKAWWLCPTCEHSWEAQIKSRNNGRGCPACSRKVVLSAENSLAATHPDIAAEWHPILNGDLKPNEVLSGSGKIAVFLCKAKNHEWKTSIQSRVLSGTCAFCKAIPNPSLARGKSNLLLPRMTWDVQRNSSMQKDCGLTSGSRQLVYWKCEMGHSGQTPYWFLLREKACLYCSSKKVLAGFNDLATTCPEVAIEWHPTLNGDLTPSQVTVGSGRMVYWICDKNHVWEAAVYSRTGNSKAGCPTCNAHNFISQPEKDLYEFITGLGFAVKQSDRSVLKNVSARELDLIVPERMFAVEFNGLYWHSELAGKGPEYHLTKFTAAQAAGVELLQVWEDDWVNRRETVLHTIASRLCAVQAVPSGELFPIELTVSQASEFLDAYCIQGAVSAEVFYGLQDDAGTLHAVLALDVDTHSAEVVRFVSRGNAGSGFVELLTHAVDVLQLSTVFTVVDNAVNHAGVFEEAGFVKTEEIAPAAYSIVNAARVADSSGMNRIWDAGKTKYRFSA